MRRRPGHILSNLFLLLLIAALYIGTVEPEVMGVSAPVYRGSAEDAVALQFAVDWEAAALPDILDTLQAQDMTATFAVSGKWAAEHPALLRRMVEAGHEIAVMGYDPAADGRLRWVMEDLEKSLQAIGSVTGGQPALYYSGSRNALVSGRAAKKAGLVQVLCTVDLLCARGTAADIAARVSDTLIPGSIILMQPTGEAAEALPEILHTLQEKGMRPVSVGDVLG